jgi:hypothetical protein
MVFTVAQCRRPALIRVTGLLLCAVQGAHAAIVNDAIDGGLDFGTSRARSCYSTLAEGPAVTSRKKLYSAVALRLNAPKVFALAADDETNQAGFDLNRLRIVVSASQW